MLPEVDSPPDVKDLRYNIDSSYGLFTRGPAGASGSICASGWSVKKGLTSVYMLRTFLVTPYVNQLKTRILRKRACWLVWKTRALIK